MLIGDWIMLGVHIGVTAFMAMFVFCVCLMVLAGVAALIGGISKAGSGEE